MKSSGIGGQAVMEGIMMKNKEYYAVAVRKPSGEIIVKKERYEGVALFSVIQKIPLIRGVFNFIDSLCLGMSTLTYSSEFYIEDEEPTEFDKKLEKILGNKADKIITGITVAISIVLALVIFMMIPFGAAELLRKVISATWLVNLAEGLIRMVIFLLYISLISKMEDIQRVFMYHGAEHKCINCIEHGMELNVDNVLKSSKEHKRCGTSFLLIVMFISILVFMFVTSDLKVIRLLLRLVLIPVIAGVSYEFLRLAGNHDNVIVSVLSKPGMMLQGMTTREPDAPMVEVAIAAVEAVFDWRGYLRENFADWKDEELEKDSKMVLNNKQVTVDNISDSEENEENEPPISTEKQLQEYLEDDKKEFINIMPEDNDIITGLPAPEILYAVYTENNTIKLKWSKIKSADSYVIYRQNEDTNSYSIYQDVKKCTFEDKEIEEGVIYYYKIRAIAVRNGKTLVSHFSPIEHGGYDGRVKSKY